MVAHHMPALWALSWALGSPPSAAAAIAGKVASFNGGTADDASAHASLEIWQCLPNRLL